MAEISGGCICGALTYKANGEPLRMGQCHCKHCQRASGTGHMSLAFFKKEDVKIEGDFTEYAAEADSGNHNIRAFCPTCGARVFSRNSANDAVVGITAGCADEHDWFEPQFIVYNKDKPAWDQMDSNVPAFEAMPPPKPAS